MVNLSKKNVYQIARKEGLNYILSSSMQADYSRNYPLDKIGIFMHLYYLEDLDYYLDRKSVV